MQKNGKRYMVLAESRETTTITRSRRMFRKVYCPHCGSATALFQLSEDDTMSDRFHTLLCENHKGEIDDGSK